MPTMRQMQREIGQRLTGLGYSILEREDEIFVLRKGGQDADTVPFEVRAQYERWLSLEDQRGEHQRPATAAEMDLLDERLRQKGCDALDQEQRTALAEGGEQAEALLDDLHVRVGIFTDDISAAMSGEDPNLAFDGDEHQKYALPLGFKPWPLNDGSPLGEEEEADEQRPSLR